jgi:hypothetical protein
MDWCTLQLFETFVMKSSKKCFWSQVSEAKLLDAMLKLNWPMGQMFKIY